MTMDLRRVMHTPPVAFAVTALLLVVAGLIMRSQIVVGFAVLSLCIAWFCAVALMYRRDWRMPMRDGSRITRASDPVLYRFWMAVFVLFGLGGLVVAFSMIWTAV
jgi:hypothetical protein